VSELEKAIQTMETVLANFPTSAVVSDIVGLINAWGAVKAAFQAANTTSTPTTGASN
jgi:hypothetical protein